MPQTRAANADTLARHEPANPADARNEAEATAMARAAAALRPRVLLAEDNTVNPEVLDVILQPCEVDVLDAANEIGRAHV